MKAGMKVLYGLNGVRDAYVRESRLSAEAGYAEEGEFRSVWSRITGSGWFVAALCAVVSLGVVTAIVMAGRNAPPVTNPPAGVVTGSETEVWESEPAEDGTETETVAETETVEETETVTPPPAFMSAEELAMLQAAREALFVPDDDTTAAIVEAMIQSGDTTWGVYPHKWKWVDAAGNIWDGMTCYGIFDRCIIFVYGNNIGDYFEVPPVGGVDLPDRLFYDVYCEGTIYTVEEAYQKGYITTDELTLVVKRMDDAERYEEDVFNGYCREGKLSFISVWEQYEGM